jgi:long-chain acyl-CoA synthetase
MQEEFMQIKKSWDGIYTKPDNLVESFETAISKYGNNRFIGTKDKSGNYQWVTYGHLGERVDHLRAGLAGIGIEKDDAVGIISTNSADWVICAFATYGLSARFVPMYEAELFSMWRYIIEDAEIKILFVSKKEIYEKLKNLPGEISTLRRVVLISGTGDETMASLENAGKATPVKSVIPSSRDIAVLIYTSGTTGDPKGVLLSHGNCTSCSQAGWHLFQELQQDSVSFSHLPWAHSYGFSAELNNWIQFGGSIALMDTLETLGADMAKVAPTYLISVPRVFNKIYAKIMETIKEEGGLKLKLFNAAIHSARRKRETGTSGFKYLLLDKLVLNKIRAKFGGRLQGALTASAKMNPEIAQFFFDIGIPVYDCYGMTETSPAITMSHSTRYRVNSVGKALEKIDIVIDRTKVTDGSDEGEIIIYGPNVMQGYHKKPDKTAEIMTPDGGIRTGDRGKLDKDGFLYITGRFKEEYKLANGKYVFPAEIEEYIKLLPYVANAMVSGDGRMYNVALIVPNVPVMEKLAREVRLSVSLNELLHSHQVKKMITKEIANHLKDKFGGYEIPQKVAFIEEDFTVENGFLTQTMKLKRRHILEKYKELIENLYTEAHPT